MVTIKLEEKEYLLDIEQAKKLNLLKEKDSRVKSWEEFKEKYKNVKGHWFDAFQRKTLLSVNIEASCVQLTSYEAEALAAFSKLLKLRRDWVGEWNPDWKARYCKAIIYNNESKATACSSITSAASLSFPTEQMAKKFLETFSDLIEKAKILI